jgi:hypothetical protein
MPRFETLYLGLRIWLPVSTASADASGDDKFRLRYEPGYVILCTGNLEEQMSLVKCVCIPISLRILNYVENRI